VARGLGGERFIGGVVALKPSHRAREGAARERVLECRRGVASSAEPQRFPLLGEERAQFPDEVRRGELFGVVAHHDQAFTLAWLHRRGQLHQWRRPEASL